MRALVLSTAVLLAVTCGCSSRSQTTSGTGGGSTGGQSGAPATGGQSGGGGAAGQGGSAGVDAGCAAADGGASDAYSARVLADKPIGYWRFDETCGLRAWDASDTGTDGWYKDVALGITGVVPGNSAASLGQQGSVTFGNNYGFPTTAAFSVEGWFRPKKVDAAKRRLFSKSAPSPSGENGYEVYVQAGVGVRFQRLADGSGDNAELPALVEKTWAHVVATYDGAQMCLYVNGAKNCAPSATKLVDNGNGFGVGSPNIFEGDVDELAVYGAALTQSQVDTHLAAANP